MITFLKAQTASLIATGVDFLSAILLVEVLHCWYVFGSVGGNLFGAVTQFMLARSWVFEKAQKQVFVQILKYVLVWAGSVLLSTLLVYALTGQLGLHYILSKMLAAVFVGITYNYLLQKNFVFR